jgi:hypothetical protein
MKIDLTSRRNQVAFLLFGIAVWVLLGFGFVDFIQTQRTREVFAAIGKANEERKSKGENIASAEAFVAALRKINVSYAKKELKPAFEAYVSGFEEGLALLKAGKSTEMADIKTQAAYQQLVEIARRYD